MNHFYRVVRDDFGRLVAVAEHVRGRGKAHSIVAAVALVAASSVGAAPDASTLPSGGRVNAGSAQIVQRPDAPVLDIRQRSQRAVIDWGRFDVGSQATVNFQQPNAQSATLNRVQAGAPSQIFGRITAPGQVFILNPSGVLFGATAQVDVGGLVATTHKLSDADFMAGRIALERGGSTGAVVNDGDIRTAIAGYAALLAPEVRNSGIIVARQGTVALAAGEAITLQFEGSHLVGLTVTPSAIDALVASRRAVQAPGGLVILAAEAAPALASGVVQVGGSLQATGAVERQGRIVLQASDQVQIAGATVDVSNTAGRGGSVQVTAPTLTVEGSAIDARGATGGGAVHLGGEWQGGGTLAQARSVTIDAGSRIDASATVSGAGGEVVAWSAIDDAQGRTSVHGTLRADGIASGGRIETSGHALDVQGAKVSAAAPNGTAGQWLLDPYNITIAAAGASGTPYAPGYTSTADSVVLASDIAASLNGGTSVTLTTGAGGASAGDINVNASIAKTAGGDAALTLQAHNDITLANGVQISSTSGRLAVTLNSDFDANGSGGIVMNTGSAILSLGGKVRLGGGSAGDASGMARGGNTAASRFGVLLDGATIDAAGGHIVINGQGGTFGSTTMGLANNVGVYIANASAVSTSGTGTVDLTGIGGTAPSAYGFNYGIGIDGSTVTAGSTGTSTLTGTGGHGNGSNAATDSKNNGIAVSGSSGSPTVLSTTGGNLVLQGTAGGTGVSSSNIGVEVSNAAVRTIGSGSLTITGTGASNPTDGYFNGVLVDHGAVVSTVDGALQMTGLGAPAGTTGASDGIYVGNDAQVTTTGTGAITLQGDAGTGLGGNSESGGILVISGADISTTHGDITMTGTAAGISTGDGNSGVEVRYAAVVHAGGSGRITIHGTAGGDPVGSIFNNGFYLQSWAAGPDESQLISEGGAITVTGIGRGAPGIRLAGPDTGGGIFNLGHGPITLNADVMAINEVQRVDAGTGTVTLRPVTPGWPMRLGEGDLYVGGHTASALGTITAGTLVIGRNDGAAAGTITVVSPIAAPLAQNIMLLTGADIVVDADLTANNRLTMTAGNGATVRGSGVLTATSLLLDGTNVDYALATGSGHRVGTLAAVNADTLAFRNADALAIGTVGSTNGIDASGAVSVATLAGDLALAQDVRTTDAGSAAIVLNAGEATAAGTASGGNVVAAGGALLTGAGGRATLMTGSIAGSAGLIAFSGGAGSGHFRYGSDEATTAYTAPLGSGTYTVYREQPTLTVTANGDAHTYDSTAYSGGNGVATSGWVNGDTTTQLQLAYTYGGNSQGAVNAGSYQIAPLGMANALGYAMTGVAGTLTIDPAHLVLVGGRTYDGSTLLPGAALVAQGVNGETFTLTGAGAAGNLASPNAVTGAALASVNGLALGTSANGGLASNYLPIDTAGSSVTIAPAPITLSTSNVAKTYDGSTAAAGTVTVTGGTLFGSDAISGGSFAFTDPNAGSGKTVTVSGVTVSDGNGGGNYAVTYASNTTSTISPAPLTLSTTGNDKTYDGSTAAPGTAVVTGGTLFGADSISGGSFAFDDRNAGTGKTVTVSGVTVSDGNGGGNYAVTYVSNTNGTVSPAPLTISTTGNAKTYDGSTVAPGAAIVTGGTLFGSDTISGGSFAFTDPNAGSGKTVTVSGVTVSDGNGGGNYAVTYANSSSGTIAPARLLISGGRDYDGTTVMAGSTLQAVGVAGQTFTVTGAGAAGNLATKDVQANQPLASLDGLALGGSTNGGLASNYLPLSPADASVTIAPRPLNVTVASVDKPFDGRRDATVVPTGDDRVPGDQLTVVPVARFDDAWVGTGKPIEVGPITLGGPDGANYVAVLAGGPVTGNVIQAPAPAPLIPPAVPPATPPAAPPPAAQVTIDPPAPPPRTPLPTPAPVAPAPAAPPASPPAARVPTDLAPRLGEPLQLNTCTERGSGQLAGFVSVRRLEPLEVPIGAPFAFTVPATTCVPCDPNATLAFEARMPNGRDPLPDWLHFEPSARRFTGTAPAGLRQIDVVVIVRDRFGVEATVPVKLLFR